MARLFVLCVLLIGLSGSSAQAQLALQLRNRVELTAFVPDTAPAWLISETDPFLAPRLSLFVDAFAGERLYALAEVRADRGEAPGDRPLQLRIEQLFLRYAPFSTIDLNLQAGKFISPFGNYPGRSHSSADPLIRPPLNYDYRTTVSRTVVPAGPTGFIRWRDVDHVFRPTGAPIVWAVPYQIGALAFGNLGKAAYRLAVMNSAPSSEPAAWDKWSDSPGPSYVAHVGYQLRPEVRLGLSYNRGPYRDDGRNDHQEIIGLELTATRGLVEVRSELLLDRWETPNVPDDPRDLSYYAELKWKLLPGLAAAGRYGKIHFNEIADDNGNPERWDYNISRWQLGALYNVTARIELRAEYMLNRGGTNDPKDNLLSLQAAWTR